MDQEKLRIVLVAGARPNFMKIAPIVKAIDRYNRQSDVCGGASAIEAIVVHTGQHYDDDMSKVFFEDLELPEPDYHLGVGSGTHAEQTGRAMIELEVVLKHEKPDVVVVVGDVNSTLAAALTAAKCCIPIAHVEAGLRSFDRRMPEEVNRLVTDALSDYLFTPSCDAGENLKKEGIDEARVFLVGNVMADTLQRHRSRAEESRIVQELSLSPHGYAVTTLHRPSNVDGGDTLEGMVGAIRKVSEYTQVVFPVHPRTQQKLIAHGLLSGLQMTPRVIMTQPLGYLDFLSLMMQSRFVMTDSGGIQEETTMLGVPCLTMRDTTEWPITVSQGTNVLVGCDVEKIVAGARWIIDGGEKRGRCPELWDGRAAERIVTILSSRS